MIKVNISATPIDNDYDFHCPIPLLLPADPDVNKDASDTQTLDTFAMVPKEQALLLQGSGDPACLADQIAMVLRTNGWPDVKIDRTRHPTRYQNKSSAWPDLKRPWFHIDGEHLVNDIKDFFDRYDKVPRVPDIPKSGICGHYPRGPKTRTEINQNYDVGSSPNPELMSNMTRLFDKISPWFLDHLNQHGLDFRHQPERVTLRMVEYVNNGKDIDYKSHVDTSVVTMLLYQDQPSLHVREYISDDFSYDQSRIIAIDDQTSRGIGTVVPGYLFSDEFDTWMPSAWHGVNTPSSVHRRRSLVVRIEPADLDLKIQSISTST